MTKSTLWIFFAFIGFSILGMGVFMPGVGNWDFISAKYGKSTVSAKFNTGIRNFLIRNDLGRELGEDLGGSTERPMNTTDAAEAKLMTPNFFVRNAMEGTEPEPGGAGDSTAAAEAKLMTPNFFVRNAVEGAMEGTEADSAAGEYVENKLMTTNLFVRNAVEGGMEGAEGDSSAGERYIPIPNTLLVHSKAQNTTNNAIMFFMIVGVMGLLVGINRKKQLAAVKETVDMDTVEQEEKLLSISKLDVQFSYAVEVKGGVREDNLQEFFEQMSPIYCEAKTTEKAELVYEIAE